MNLTGADIYTDFSGFGRLRADARAGDGAANAQVARQVEALFVGMLIKSMREAGADLGAGGGAGVQQGLYDSQLALAIAGSGRLGFARTMLREIAPPGAGSPGTAPAGFATPARNAGLPARDWAAVRASARAPDAGAAARAAPAAPGTRVEATPPSSPEAFVRALWPAASRAARALGTRPEAVLAVAALETGWGRHVPARADGSPSHNLFGIKAHGWDGDVTHAPTLEFENGAFTRRVEPFRAYGSAEDAVADFARFVSTQPRYRDALASGGDPVKFVRALHAAGYATDPRYGDKLEALIGSAPLRQAAAAAASTQA